ncbi:MAG TPA: hypothetical protein VH988_17830 [Thermoanaerobaculia bacterium]|nr:hypothetical protein [Thermoanaerobaculia bacterium]
MADPSPHQKDVILDRLARRANVAQFVSFGPNGVQRHAWLRGREPNLPFASLEEAVAALLAASPERSVNVRSYAPASPKAREFLYGKTNAEEVAAAVRRLAAEGLFTIVNETVDIEDGGVSGVAFGDILEFAPGDTPRCVEKPGTAALPRRLGLRLLETVYGFAPSLHEKPEMRVEFSLHPLRRGVRHEHTILWETEKPGPPPSAPEIAWPNRFSRHVGDKAFGLLIADALGLPVPRVQVIPRRLAPFRFGVDTSLAETWIRTCPVEQVPGFFTTHHGWLDPFRLLAAEDPQGDAIASILAQQAVDARHSGALVAQPGGEPLIEGVAGSGDDFMTGRKPPEELPAEVLRDVRSAYGRAASTLGPVRCEWVHDGARVWVLQLHRGGSASSGRVVHPGDAERYHRFDVAQRIEALRELISRIQGSGDGVVLVGRVGVTSHFGDLLRRAQIPSRIEEGPG